jgi:hypothetical protein
MGDFEFTKIVEEILKNGGVNIDGLNFFGNFQTDVVTYLEMSHLLLAKLSCVTFFDFTEELIEKFFLNTKEVRILNEINEQIKTMYSIARKQIIKNYVLLAMMKKNMDELLINSPEKDLTDLLQFVINGLNPNTPGAQKQITDTDIFGGGSRKQKIIELLFMFFLFFCIAIPVKNETEIALLPGDQDETIDKLKAMTTFTRDDIVTYNKAIIEVDVKKLASSMKDIIRQETEPVNVNQMVVKHDKDMQQKIKTLVGYFEELFLMSEKGKERLTRLIEKFNTEFAFLSRQFEGCCLSLVNDAQEHGVFSVFKNMNTLKKTQQKISDAQKEITENNNNMVEQITQDLTGAAGSILAMDGASLTAYIYSLGINVAEYLSYNSTESTTIIEEHESVQNEFESSFTSENERSKFEETLSIYSKLYCSYGFNLKLELNTDKMNETNIKIVGDKVPYEFLLKFIKLLRNNIDYKMRTLFVDKSQDSRRIMPFLSSLNQRLGILQLVVTNNDDLVNYFGHNKIFDIVNQGSSMNDFEDYFSSQISRLKELLKQLGETYPLFNAQQEREREIALASIAQQVLEQEIKDITANGTSFIERQKAERSAKQNIEWYKSMQSYWGSWGEIAKNATSEMTEFTVKTFGDTVVIGPLRGLLQVLNDVLYELVTTPSGWFLIMSMTFSFLYLLSGIRGTIQIFTRGPVMFFAFVWGCFVFIYKVIKSPFGFIYRHVRTIFVPPQRQLALPPIDQNQDVNAIVIDAEPQQHENWRRDNKEWYTRILRDFRQDPLEIPYDYEKNYEEIYHKVRKLNRIRGGKLKKNKKTRKHKRRITKKKGKGKKRYTRHNRRKSKKN